MAVVRFFGPAREAADAASLVVPGVTVSEVLDALRAQCGPDLAAVLTVSKVWIGGDPAGLDDLIGPDDELAVLPPVSGG